VSSENMNPSFTFIIYNLSHAWQKLIVFFFKFFLFLTFSFGPPSTDKAVALQYLSAAYVNKSSPRDKKRKNIEEKRQRKKHEWGWGW